MHSEYVKKKKITLIITLNKLNCAYYFIVCYYRISIDALVTGYNNNTIIILNTLLYLHLLIHIIIF